MHQIIAGSVIAVSSILVACSGSDSSVPSEPVAASEIKVPDAPGASGVTADKPAGVGSAAVSAVQAETSVSAKSATPAGHGNAVTTTEINVRKGPGKSFEVVRVLKSGAAVTIQSCKLGWCLIADGEYVGEKLLNKKSN